MIVRDEAEWLPLSLSSVRGAFFETIIVDTGSRDRTREIAVEFGAQVFDFEWINDFSTARNFAAAQAKSEWIFFLDADECLLKRDLQSLSSLMNAEADVFEICHRNYLQDKTLLGAQSLTDDLKADLEKFHPQASSFHSFVDGRQARLYRNGKSLQWTRKVHESILPSARELNCKIAFASELVIHHLAALKDPNYLQKKNEKYLKLMIERLQENPHEPAAWFDIALEWTKQGRVEEAVKSYRQALKLRPVWPEAERNLNLLLQLTSAGTPSP